MEKFGVILEEHCGQGWDYDDFTIKHVLKEFESEAKFKEWLNSNANKIPFQAIKFTKLNVKITTSVTCEY